MANRHMKRCSTSLIREMQIKTTMRCYLILSKTLQITNAGQCVEKREPSYTGGMNVSWCSHCEKQYGGFLSKLKIKLSFDPGIPLLGVYWQNFNSKRYIHLYVHSSTTDNSQDMETT